MGDNGLKQSRAKLLIFANAISKRPRCKIESKCGLFFKYATTSRLYWLKNITSFIGSRRIMIAHIMNTETTYCLNGSKPSIERVVIMTYLVFNVIDQTVIKGLVEVNATKDGERNINYENNSFHHLAISYTDAEYYYNSKLKKIANYHTHIYESDTCSDIICNAITEYVEKNAPDLKLSKFPLIGDF